MWILKDKKALITGGTKGIGLATVHTFLSLGATVIFTARTENDVIQIEKELQANSFEVYGIKADITIKEDREYIREFVASKWNKLDILVNNAGHGLNKQILEFSYDEVKKVTETILLSPFEMSRILFEFIDAVKGGTIINISSIAGLADMHTGSLYGMSKAGLIQQTKNLAVEWAKYGIRVNCVSPGFTNTPRASKLLEDVELSKTILAKTPLKRIATPQEIANVIAFLAMDKSSFITGQNIIVDGGLTINGY